jgi:uncharacterized membrane protein YgaE (UPF0421/DUF939 family)
MLQFPKFDLFWTLISIILVISPEEKNAALLTTERVISNLIGSVSGLIVYFLPINELIKISLAIVLAVMICRLFQLMKVVRSAVVAVLIILIEHKSGVLTPFERFLTVLIGCLIGLIVTLSTTLIINQLKKKFNLRNEN